MSKEFNPYAAPAAVEVELPKLGTWRDGDCLVARLETEGLLTKKCLLPKICIVTGDHAINKPLKQTISSGPFIVLVYYFLSELRYRDRQRNRRIAWLLIALGVLVEAVGLLLLETFQVGGLLAPGQIIGFALVPTGVLAMLPGVFRLQRQNEPLRLLKIHQGHAWIQKASERFLDQIPDIDSEYEPR